MFSKLVSEIKALKKRTYIPYTEPYLAVFKENHMVYLVSQRFPDYETLTKTLETRSLSFEERLGIFQKLCRILSSMSQASPPLSHGHLHPDNILLPKTPSPSPRHSSLSSASLSLSPIIIDQGFSFFKKYVQMINSDSSEAYVNKGPYSSPQQTLTRGSVTEKEIPQDDVFSLGMIGQRMFAQVLPLADLTLPQMKQVYESKDWRRWVKPIKDAPKLSEILSICLQFDPQKRPTFATILQRLESV